MANLGTTGFKREDLAFATHVERLDLPGSSLALARVAFDVTPISAPGALERTGNPFDFAIDGSGFFAVETAGGVRYTRDGRFSTNQLGELVTTTGHRVLDDGGSPIFIPAQVSDLTLSADGTLSAPDGGPLGVLGDPGAACTASCGARRTACSRPRSSRSPPSTPRSFRAFSKARTSIRSASSPI